EMVYESRTGDVFVLGASSWRIEDITADQVLVSPAPGQPGKLPFWHGDTIGRPAELGQAIGAYCRELGAAGPAEATARLRGAGLGLLDAEEVEPLVTAELGSSALFASRFRECAARALLLPRRQPGRRTPLWQQRQRSAQLLAVASQYATFPIVLETLRECLQDVFDVPALAGLMRDLSARKIRLVEVETPAPSPFGRSLLFRYVGAFM